MRASKGKTAGRGTKGTKARYQVPARFEGGQMPLHMRLPKLRGFKNPFRVEYQVVNLDRSRRSSPRVATSPSTTSSPRAPSATASPVKVLGTGEITVTVAVDGAHVLGLRQGEDRGRRRHAATADRRSDADRRRLRAAPAPPGRRGRASASGARARCASSAD